MAHSQSPSSPDTVESVFKEYVLDVRLVECRGPDDEVPRYRFDAPDHTAVMFEDPELAQLYADVYFDANGFVEADTGDRGVPPELVQAGKDTLAAYLMTQPGTDINWVASFYGTKPAKIEKYLSWVQQRAAEVREQVITHQNE